MTMTNQKIQYTEEMVGQAHATKSDTLNRLVVGVNNFRLIKSGANLTLSPIRGNLVDINGNVYAVTSLPTLSAAGLTPDTTYYIYLYSSSGTATLEASVTGFSTDASGRDYKTGDATRRLMGMARPITGPAWTDTATQRLVLSRDNRKPLACKATMVADRSTASLTIVELSSADRCDFLVWADSSVMAQLTGTATNSATGNTIYSYIGVDGTVTLIGKQSCVPRSDWNPIPCCIAGTVDASILGAGYHYATAAGYVSAGTGTWYQDTALFVTVN